MDIQTVAKKLASHDWYYHYSDDYGVYSRGRQSWDALIATCKQVTPDVLKPLWEKHAPKDFHEMFDRLFVKK